MSWGDDLEQRLVLFAARVVKISSSLPSSLAGKHIAGQLVRSGTAPAAHFAEARGAESTADFIHKLRLAAKEMNETEIWLRIIVASELLENKRLRDILDECNQLKRILNSSISTARKSKKKTNS